MLRLIRSLFRPSPHLEDFRRGLIILSCSDAFAGRIVARTMEWMPHVQWTVLQRFEPPLSSGTFETLYSSHAVTLSRKFVQLTRFRRQQFDVLVLACTNEESFIPLKLFGVLTGIRALVIFNENIDAFVLSRETIPVLFDHWRWRMSLSYRHHPARLIASFFSWIFLFPIGFAYLAVHILILSLRKSLR